MKKTSRCGLGKGLGKGYKNLVPKDPMVHSLSAKGVSQKVELELVRVPYGKANTPKKDREYIMRGGSPVGTIKEWRDFAKGSKIKKLVVNDTDDVFMVKLNARGYMNTIQLDPEYSVITYSEGTRNGFRHVAILMRNGYELNKATVNYLNRTWESYDFQTVIHKLFDKAFDENKAKILKADLDKSGGRSLFKLMAKGNKINSKNLVDYIMVYEGGDLSSRNTLNLFSYLIKTGQAWTLQGHYGRQAQALIDNGFISKEGKINFKKIKSAGYKLDAKGHKDLMKKMFQFEDLNPEYPNWQMDGLIKEIKRPETYQDEGYIDEKIDNIKRHYDGALENFRNRVKDKELQKEFLKEVKSKKVK